MTHVLRDHRPAIMRFCLLALLLGSGDWCVYSSCHAQTASVATGSQYYASASGDVDGKDGPDLVEISKRGKGLVLSIVPGGTGESSAIEQMLPGSYIFYQDGKPFGLHLINMTGDGRPEIVTITADSASLGAYVQIYRIRDGRIENLLKNGGGWQFKFEKTANGGHRLLCYGKWTDASTETLEAYDWDGSEFRRRRITGQEKRPRTTH